MSVILIDAYTFLIFKKYFIFRYVLIIEDLKILLSILIIIFFIFFKNIILTKYINKLKILNDNVYNQMLVNNSL